MKLKRRVGGIGGRTSRLIIYFGVALMHHTVAFETKSPTLRNILVTKFMQQDGGTGTL